MLPVDNLFMGLLVLAVFQLDPGRTQETGGVGLRFPNLFAGLGAGNNPFSLTNLFRPNRPQQQPPPASFATAAANLQPAQQPFSNGVLPPPQQQLSPQQPGPNPFLQAPPVAFQPPAFPTFIQNPGSPVQQFQQVQPVGSPGFVQPQGQFQPSQPAPVPVHLQQPTPQPWPFGSNNNPHVPTLLPIGNLPIAGSPPVQQGGVQQTQQQQPTIIPSPPGPPPPPLPTPNIVPSQPLVLTPASTIQQQQTAPQPFLLPAQFALSANSPSQQKNSARAGKSLALAKPAVDLTTASSNVIDCGAGNDVGFCASSEKYPRNVVDDMMHRCHDIVRQMYVEIPEDYEGLGDSHHPIGSGQESANGSSSSKSPSSPWSWSDYRKESACDSELRFIAPHVAQDRSGRWRIIVQTDEFPQRVAIDVCRRVNDVCKVFTDCGRKSRCVQRYSYHTLISLDQEAKANGQCPTMAVFRFPTSCVCHVEVDKPIPSKSDRRTLSINGVKLRS